MAENGGMSLAMKIAGGGFDDLVPYELVLEEGFSRVYRGELTVLTKALHTHKDLRELLDQNLSLTLSQRLAGGLVRRSRCLHGIITGIASRGAVSQGESSNCYRYGIIIESELARLRHTSLNFPYYRKTPADIIEDILGKYQIQGRFEGAYINRGGYSKNLMFDQAGASDLDFIRRIMGLYGLSWTFTHPAAKAGVGSAELYFTGGSQFPPPVYEYSDKRKCADIEKFDSINYDEGRNLWKMEGWRMESAIGVDGLEVTASYPEANHGSREWRWGECGPGKRYYSYASLFHGYERRAPTEEIDGDIKHIIEARRIAWNLEKETWTGGGENMILMPGLILELSHFYGARDNKPITALVTDTRLHVRALWPRDLAQAPADAETGEAARVEFSAADWGGDSEKRYCGNGR